MPKRDEFEVICDTVLGPLPRLTPWPDERGPRPLGIGHAKREDADLSWTHGAIPPRHRLGYIEPEWRD